jgi:ferrous iron transport protein A
VGVIAEGSSLADLDVGARATVTSLDLGPMLRRRLAELGVRPGAEITVLHRTSGGGRVVAVQDGRIALDRATVSRLQGRPARELTTDHHA